ncbi:Pregnancy-associated plasma protein-A [Nocardioides dokdonensis FR1436]|uniref:Pregnancy-associated plasma protein-A n=1 Tax=Nocardioides dokdonensis FR1436 TaxID=1300347 RepID=A0A1A9GM01_9ACTN|nr:zinc metalloprotease [Nocardioides dokdonensis]ANH38710.1 Pregnancy-associated plasma protein-A [Nocardioides dokdonensis FR1436]
MRPRQIVAALATSAVAVTVLTGAAPADLRPVASPGVQACAEAPDQARVRQGAQVAEPALYAKKDARKYGVIKDLPTLAPGSVEVETVFHVVTETTPTPAQRARTTSMIDAQMQVLNDAYAGTTSPDAAATPFRFTLDHVTWTVDATWAHVSPGKPERDMKAALHEGDSETLNVYAADIGDNLLGWAYFPKGYNNGRDYIDGVVLLDESMPGGTVNAYNEGDTLTHEVGHWLMLEHTFAGGCSASGDGVADTPREAVPQFGCPEGADTCPTPGLDPIHNFMDYSVDACMDMFTPGQADRMSDAWQDFRAGGNG